MKELLELLLEAHTQLINNTTGAGDLPNVICETELSEG